MFIGFAVNGNAQYLIDQTTINTPQTSNSGFEPYKRDYIGEGNMKFTRIDSFKFEGNKVFYKQTGIGPFLLWEYHYGKSENGNNIYYLYYENTKTYKYDNYIIVPSDKSKIYVMMGSLLEYYK